MLARKLANVMHADRRTGEIKPRDPNYFATLANDLTAYDEYVLYSRSCLDKDVFPEPFLDWLRLRAELFREGVL